jgi:hypothetical protein
VDGDAGAQGFAGVMDGGRVGQSPRLALGQGQVGLAGQGQQQGLEGRFGALVVQGPAQGGGETLLVDLVGGSGGAVQHQFAGEVLAGLPATEQVGVGG